MFGDLALEQEVQTYGDILSSKNSVQVDGFLKDRASEAMRCLRALEPADASSISLRWLPTEAGPAAGLIWSEPPNRIVFGLELIRRLDTAIMVFAGFLYRNYLDQILGLGPFVPLPLQLSPADFVDKALALYPRNMLAGLSGSREGELNDYEKVQRMMSAVSPENTLREAALAGQVFSKPIQLHSAYGSFEKTEARRPSLFVLYLHRRMLVDAIRFVLAHELGHIRLGHLETDSPNHELERMDEVAADGWALEHLGGVADFQARSIVSLFSHLRRFDAPESADPSHPLARGRLALLAAAALRSMRDPALIEDLNAAMQTIAEPIPVELSKPRALEAGLEVEVSAFGASNLRYGTAIELTLNVKLPKRMPESDFRRWHEAVPQQEWAAGSRLAVNLTLASLIHPKEVYRQFQAVIVPRKGDGVTSLAEHVSTLVLRFELASPLSDWWRNPDAILTACKISIANEPGNPSETSEIRYLSVPEIGAGLALVEETVRNESATASLVNRLSAAENCCRLLNCLPEAEAIAVLNVTKFGDLTYDRVIFVAEFWAAKNKLKQAADLVISALARNAVAGPGYYCLLGRNAFDEGTPDAFWTAYDFAYREKMMWGKDGRYSETAAQLIQEVLERQLRARDVLCNHFVSSARAYAEGCNALQSGNTVEAPSYLTVAYTEVVKALQISNKPLLFLSQTAGETALAMVATGADLSNQVRKHFQDVVGVAPDFLPAYTELAKLELEMGRIAEAKNWLRLAATIRPHHEMIDWVQKGINQAEERELEPALKRGYELLSEGRSNELEPAFGKWLSKFGSSSSISRLKGLADLAEERFGSAIESFTHCLESEGLECTLLVWRGLACIEDGQLASGMRDIRWMLAFSEEWPVLEDMDEEMRAKCIPYTGRNVIACAQVVRALGLLREGRLDEAANVCSLANGGFEDNGTLILATAEVLAATGKLEAASAAVRRALSVKENRLPPEKRRRAEAFLTDGSPVFFGPFPTTR